MRILNQLLVLLLMCTVTGMLVSRARGQAAQPYATATPYTTATAPAVEQLNPYANLPDPYKPVQNVKQTDIAEHLRLAAEHLRAAGRTELAQQITNESLVEQKLRQIRKLQAEIDQLRKDGGAEVVLKLHLKVIELQTSKMRSLGFDLETASNSPGSATSGIALYDAQVIEKLLAALRKNGLARVLAEPTLVTVSGRPASFRSGGEIPIPVPQSTGATVIEYRPTGTRVDCLGKILENGRIRLELRSTITEINEALSVLLNDVSVPGLRTRMIDTVVELADGQTVVLGGLVQQEKTNGAATDTVESTDGTVVKPDAETDASDTTDSTADSGADSQNEEKTLLVTITVHVEQPTPTSETAESAPVPQPITRY